MPRATKGEIRDLLRDLNVITSRIRDAVGDDNGVAAVVALQESEDALEDLRALLEDRYDEEFTEIEGEIVEEGEVVEEEEPS